MINTALPFTNLSKTNIDYSGTSLLGYIPNVNWKALAEMFGQPLKSKDGLGGKVYTQWILRIGGTLVTIYDYKQNGRKCDSYDWHVGGFSKLKFETLRNLQDVIFTKSNITIGVSKR